METNRAVKLFAMELILAITLSACANHSTIGDWYEHAPEMVKWEKPVIKP